MHILRLLCSTHCNLSGVASGIIQLNPVVHKINYFESAIMKFMKLEDIKCAKEFFYLNFLDNRATFMTIPSCVPGIQSDNTVKIIRSQCTKHLKALHIRL